MIYETCFFIKAGESDSTALSCEDTVPTLHKIIAADPGGAHDTSAKGCGDAELAGGQLAGTGSPHYDLAAAGRSLAAIAHRQMSCPVGIVAVPQSVAFMSSEAVIVELEKSSDWSADGFEEVRRHASEHFRKLVEISSAALAETKSQALRGTRKRR